MTIQVGAVLIVKNEERIIGRCLKSVADLDETVVLDTGSSDGTVEACETLGVRVVRTVPASPFHFAEARNAALAQVRTPWAFTIDADEVLRPGGVRKMRKALEDAGDRTAFTITFIDQAHGSPRTVFTRKIKLFRKDACEWRYRVHERLFDRALGVPVTDVPGAVGPLEAVSVEHLPERDKSARRGQNLELLRLCIRENPEYIRAFRHLGQELMLAGKWEEAIPPLVHYAGKTDEDPLHVSVVLTHVGSCLGNMGRLEECLVWFDRAAMADRRRREPLYLGALYAMHAARTVWDIERAMDLINRLLEIPVSARPESSNDWPAAWGGEPLRMLASCRRSLEELASRKA